MNTREKQIKDAAVALRQLRDEAKAMGRKEADLTQADWARIAGIAGQLQRRARQLGGLGRGG